ncbi:MAG: hypothetical protein ACREAU_09295 [Nitrosopumilaceae archaeon]
MSKKIYYIRFTEEALNDMLDILNLKTLTDRKFYDFRKVTDGSSEKIVVSSVMDVHEIISEAIVIPLVQSV